MPPLTSNQQNAINNTSITTNQLENPTPTPNLPSSQANLTTPPITLSGQLSQAQQLQNQMQQQEQVSLQNLTASMFGTGGVGARTLQAEEQAGIPRLQTELVDIENQIAQKNLQFRRMEEEILKRPGSTMASARAELAQAQRANASELADLEVIRSARSNTLANTQSLIQRKLDLQFADEERNLKNLQFIYEKNEGKYKDAVGRVIKLQERALDKEKSKFEALETEKINLVRNAQVNGAGNSVLSSILQSNSIEEAYKNAGNFGISIDDKIKKMKFNDLLKVSNTVGGFDPKTLEKLSTNKTALQASARIGIIKAIKMYEKEAQKILGRRNPVTNLYITPTKEEIVALRTALNTTVGSAINVAQGQGAMGDEEAQRILGELQVHRLKRLGVLESAVSGVVSAQNTLLENDLATLESFYPGATEGVDLFRDYSLSKLPLETQNTIKSIDALESSNWSDDQIVEYLSLNDPSNGPLIQSLYSQGFSLQEIKDNL